jgi:hypothetical protein
MTSVEARKLGLGKVFGRGRTTEAPSSLFFKGIERCQSGYTLAANAVVLTILPQVMQGLIGG